MNNFQLGKINPNLIKDYKNLNYKNRPFNDKDTLLKWQKNGHMYEKYTGLMRDESTILPSWCYNIVENFDFIHASSTIYCMKPGTIMPEHKDTYIRYKEINNLPKEYHFISRAIVFLEDWDSGHYFEINKNPIINWKRGDYVMWDYDIPHIAANIGNKNRYTLQITGVKI